MVVDIQGHSTYLYTGGRPFDAALAVRGTVIFIHGAEQDHACWGLQSRWFAHHGYGVLVPDLPGHGRSAGAALGSIAALADWVVALLDALGIGEASLVGHSMGALVALEAGLRYPERIRRLALIGGAVPMPVADALLDAAEHDEPRAIALVNLWSHSPRGLIGGNRVPGLWMTGVNQRVMERQRPGVFLTDLRNCNDYQPADATLAALAVPVLLVNGSKDRMTPVRAARQFAERLPGARLTFIDGGGHALMAEKPDEVLDVLRDFLA
jgi:pimeloyl-ACP methyl ester carboxylesterase